MARLLRTGSAYEAYPSNEARGGSMVGITIKNRRAFGEFCQALNDHHVSFSLAGSQTISLSKSPKQLPQEIQRFLYKLETDSSAVVHEAAPERRRHIPTREEAEETLRQLAGRSRRNMRS